VSGSPRSTWRTPSPPTPRIREAAVIGVENLPDGQADPPDGELLTAERHAALREAFSRLPPDGQQMMAMLIADPPVPYAEISARLGIAVGSIGPKRRRYLDKLRRDPAISALISGKAAVNRSGTRGRDQEEAGADG
jgi:DNA-directed RNA polymerase specialized sigma24 family protein